MPDMKRLVLLVVLGGGLAACGATPSVSPTAAPVQSSIATPTPTATPSSSPTATPPAAPTPSPAPSPKLTTTCAVTGTAQGGSVSWTGTGASWQLLISPGGIVVNPTNTSGEYGPLNAGTYTYEFKDAGGNEVMHGQFQVAACAT